LGEALKRAEAYHDAGSDGILIHSALSTPTEVLAFKREWADRSPVLIVPTKYYSTPTDALRAAGFSIAIWANHMLRAALTAMQACAETLATEQNLLSIEDEIASVKEIFRLQGTSELQDAEEHYLPKRAQQSRAIILAASRGGALGALTDARPKTMVEVGGQPLLGLIVAAYNACAIKDITVVRGYLAETVNLPSLNYVDNPDYAKTGELLSLACALDADSDDDRDLYVSFGDVIFKRYILDSLAEPEADFVISADTNWQESVNLGRAADYVHCTAAHSRRDFYREIYLQQAGESIAEAQRHGEWMGVMKVSSKALPALRELVTELAAKPENRRAKLHQLLDELVRRGHRVRVIYTTGHWLDVDSLDDVLAAGTFR
jgi:phosphoenolpyruvate phosphomutase